MIKYNQHVKAYAQNKRDQHPGLVQKALAAKQRLDQDHRFAAPKQVDHYSYIDSVDAANIVFRHTNLGVIADHEHLQQAVKTACPIKYPAMGLANALTVEEAKALNLLEKTNLLQSKVRTTKLDMDVSEGDRRLIQKGVAAYDYITMKLSEGAREWLLGPNDSPRTYTHCVLHLSLLDKGNNPKNHTKMKKIIVDMGAQHINLRATGKKQRAVSKTQAIPSFISATRKVLQEVLSWQVEFETLWNRGYRSVDNMIKSQNNDELITAGLKLYKINRK